MEVHIFTGEGTYNQSFIKFYETNFELADQLFVFRCKPEGKYQYGDELKKRILYVENSSKFITKLFFKLLIADKIYFHYFPVGPSLYFWYSFKFILKKATWILWGGDLYYYKYRSHDMRSNIYEFLRKGILKKIPHVACFIKGDYELVKKIYHSKADYTYIVYPIPVDFKYIESLPGRKDEQAKTILLGNSSDPSNEHLHLMEQLERFKDLNIRIICPLSYGGENNYVREVEDYGRKLFGEKFIPLKNFIPPGEYAKILREVDVALFNHKRQQALGTVLSLLYVGAKVFIRVETTSFETLLRLGLKLYPIEELGKLDFDDFVFLDDETKTLNKKAVGREFSNENYVRIWKNLFKDAQLKKNSESK